jgi:hypothetical protein
LTEPASKSERAERLAEEACQQKADWQARERLLRSHNLVVETQQGHSSCAQGHWHSRKLCGRGKMSGRKA